MLTDLLLALPVSVLHWLFRLTGTYDGVHDWFEDCFCPCGGAE
ncbi:MAG: hypothetical protein ACXVGF_04545 [Blastococcus sp.]